MISTFVDPIDRPARIPFTESLPGRTRPANLHSSWADFAFARIWPAAIMQFLASNSSSPVKMWFVINSLAAEALADNRPELREIRRDILNSVRDLRIGGRIHQFTILGTKYLVTNFQIPSPKLSHFSGLAACRKGNFAHHI